ncbi:LysR family transcriptional regulator [Lysobacter sp. BMK333-48F3]|uniref:LysR family transcriptional regulator n=1 Tax=Lysobacter sp. BMK333-48F3 TaxID=2867962 RepID=UPI001C8B95D6|nr:LysR family transcriptional regulator [Lysobacter sp. BMK333-48F3]MBX9401646.1 LysR family transcriptional regulator [Lysobacter sp. BMK333-48F3]
MSRQFDALMLGSIELFCLCAEAESFTAAAQQAGLTPAAVSRAVARLEARLGVQLFVRSTRRVRLTDAGRRYLAHCRLGLNQLAEAEREVSGQQRAPAGKVRLSLPTPVAHHLLLPALARFRRAYPEVTLDIQLSNRNIDFTADGFDLAVRGRTPPDSGLIVRKLFDAALVVVAAPDYLQRAGVPRTLEDLAAHDCLQFVLPSSGQAVPWQFRRDGRDLDLDTRGGLQCSDDFLGPATLARAGAGLLQTYRFIVADDLAQGRLQAVLGDYAGRSRPFSLVYPSARHVSSRVRALIDFLIAEWPAQV